MSKRNQRRRKNKQKIPLWPFMAGFVLLVAAFLLIPGKNGPTPPSAEEYSTIPVKVNFPAPELSLNNVKGETQSLADFRDKIVLVNNWATWCPPCKAELPTLVKYYNDYAAAGFLIIGIEAGEPADHVASFVQQYQITYPVWLDPNNLSGRAFKNSNLPNSYLIDRTGTIRLAWTGQISRSMLDKYVTPLVTTE